MIEFTNYCKNNCLYCGIRRDNRCVERYRARALELGNTALAAALAEDMNDFGGKRLYTTEKSWLK